MEGNTLTVLGFPRQGTDFLMSCLMPGFRYSREYFNPLCNPRLAPKIRQFFGSEHPFTRGLFARPDEETFSALFEDWRMSFDINKEVFSFRKSDMFSERSHVLYLFRSHTQTFPSSRPEYITPIFDSFVGATFEKDSPWEEVRNYLSEMKIQDPKAKQVLIHATCWYLQVLNSRRPLLNYAFLMKADKEDIFSRLSEILPNWMDAKAASERIVKGRRCDMAKRRNRWLEFAKNSGVEKMRYDLIKFLESLDLMNFDFMKG